jgi:heme A synthase
MTPTSAVPLASYAVLIGITSVVLWIWTPYTLPPALLSAGALLFAVLAAIVALRGRAEKPQAAETEPVPDLSFATVGVALGIINIVVGLYLGLYLILIGAGILAFGLGGWIREVRAERRAREIVDAQ